MGFWPFGGGKRQRVVDSEEHGRETLLKRASSGAIGRQGKKAEDAARRGRTDSNKAREDSKTRRLSKTRNHESKTVLYAPPARSQTTPVRSIDSTQRASRTNSQYNEKSLYSQPPLSQTSLGPENFSVTRAPPTLYGKRPDNDSAIPRRKSSKRKAEEFAREREIRAMTSSPIPIPKRPATLYGTGPLQRDSRHFPGPLNRRLERPTSEISLPLPGSLPDISDFPSQNSFKVSMLAALSPRPIVRYDASSKNANGKQPVRPNMAIRQAIAEEDYSDKKRIDELADDLDAGGLRELMERDRRRRERKKDAEKVKLQRKLQRRAERQREEEARRARTEAFVQSSPGEALGHPGLGIASPPGASQSSFQRHLTAMVGDDPFQDTEPSNIPTNGPIRNPFDDEKELDIAEQLRDSDDEAAISGDTPTPVRFPSRRTGTKSTKPRQQPSQSTLSPPTSPTNRPIDRSSLSQASFVNRDTTNDVPEGSSLERRISDGSSLRITSWTTFFKRGNRRKFTGPAPGRTTPSEFSNTSRESVTRKQPPPSVAPRTFRRSDSATPQRTMSRFREDLPELPISPPDSRLQSPEAAGIPAGNVVSSSIDTEAIVSPTRNSSIRDGTGQQAVEQLDRPEQKTSVDLDARAPGAAGLILSQSLASVDSEGSWLAGRPPKRVSSQLSHSLRPSQSSLQKSVPNTLEKEGEADSTEQDVNDRLNATLRERQSPRQQQSSQSSAITTGLSLSKGEKQPESLAEASGENPSIEVEGEKWHQSVGKHPTMIEQAGRTKSDEAILNEISTAENSNSSSGEGGDDQISDINEQEAKLTPILRATSVKMKGHIRHISAGSAKLLDIKRSSTHSDMARTSKSDVASQSGSIYKEAES